MSNPLTTRSRVFGLVALVALASCTDATGLGQRSCRPGASSDRQFSGNGIC